MTDDRFVEAQSHEIQKIAHEIISKGMPLDNQFQVTVIIDKLRFQKYSKAQNKEVLARKPHHVFKDRGGGEKTWSRSGGEHDLQKVVHSSSKTESKVERKQNESLEQRIQQTKEIP